MSHRSDAPRKCQTDETQVTARHPWNYTARAAATGGCCV